MTEQGLRELLAGGKLTDRELQVLHGAALGEKAWQTGNRLHLAVETVRCYRKTAAAKLDASNTTRAVVVAIGAGMLNLERLVEKGGSS